MKRLNLIDCGLVITFVLAGGAARAGWTPPESSVTPPAVVNVDPFTARDWTGSHPEAALVVGPDGALYGSAQSGGANFDGTLFRLATDGTFTKLHDFNGTDGQWPSAALVVGSDGALYGSAGGGGAYGYGTIFRLATDGTFAKLHDFNGTDGNTDGNRYPYAPLVVGPDGALYGSSDGGGISNNGTLFRVETNGTFTTLHDFNGADGTHPDEPLVVGPDGALYGSTVRGGSSTYAGTLFRVATDGTFAKLHDFNGTDGSLPLVALVVGPDGALYGSTFYGGIGGGVGQIGDGTLFRLETNGTFTKLHDFNSTDGEYPTALVVGSDGALYGSADTTLFRLATDGTFTNLHDFNLADGADPEGGLVVGPDGALYGLASGGGANDLGTLFRLTTDGTFTKLHDFDGHDAFQPNTPLVVGPDGALYGSSGAGGTGGYSGYGTLYRLATDGTVTQFHDFGYSDGDAPSALVAGPDGALYGVTYIGNTNNAGRLFRLGTDGTFTYLHDFNGTDGSDARAALVVGPDGALYGSTYGGGASYEGTLFRVTTDGTFTNLHDFNGTDGAGPSYAALVVGPDGALYGSTTYGGASGVGTLFRLTTDGTFTKLLDFGAALVVGPDSALYGSTDGGGISNNGALFRLTTDGTFTKLHDFNGLDGSGPSALVVGPDGALYGSTYSGGASGGGTVFRLTTDGTFTKLHDSYGDALVVGPDGALYGLTYVGGASAYDGTLFRLATDGTFTDLHDFNYTYYGDPSGLVAGPDYALYGWTARGGSRGGSILFKLVLDHAPFADASATPALVLSPNGTNATVILDGSRSSDPDADALQYTWHEAGAATPLANGVVALRVLSAGTNSIGLVVNDGQLSGANSVTIEVITAAGAVSRLVDLLNTDPSAAQTFATTLTAALTSIDRADPASAINQLTLFQNQVQAQVQPLDSAMAASLIQTAQDTIDSLNEDLANPGSPSHGQFTAVSRQTNGLVQLQFSGVSGLSYIVEASGDLQTWELIGVATPLGGGQFEFEDAQAGSFGQRFYRLVQP